MIQQGVPLPVHLDGVIVEIDLGEEDPVAHVVLRMAAEELLLQLELDDGHGLVHFGGQDGVHRVIDIFVQHVGGEALAGVVPIDFGGKHGQGAQVDAVAVLQLVKVVVADRPAKDAGHAGLVACEGPQPGDVVVAPLDVHVVELPQPLQDPVGQRWPRSKMSPMMWSISTAHSWMREQSWVMKASEVPVATMEEMISS